MKRKIKRFFKRALTSFLAFGMFFSYLPQSVFAAEDETVIVSESEKEESSNQEEAQPVQEEQAPSAEEIAPSTPSQEEAVVTPESVEIPEEVPSEEIIAEDEIISEEEIISEDEVSEDEVSEDEVIAEEVVSDEEIVSEENAANEKVIEDKEQEEEIKLVTMVRPKMMLGSPKPNPNPSPAPEPEPKGDPEDAKEYYPENSEMQNLYVKYGDDFKNAADSMIDNPSNENLVTLMNSLNTEENAISNPENITGVDANKNSLGNIVMADGKDTDGDGYPDPMFFSYEKDDTTNEIKVKVYQEKSVEGLTDEMIEDETVINEIIKTYGEENTSVDKYYDEEYKELIQPKNGANNVNMSPTNQNGVKFTEPITTTDSEGNTVYLYNYKFDFAGETATVENGKLRWDDNKKRDYGDRGYGCWIFVDKNNKEWNLTNMSTTSTGSHNIKALPYSDEYMNSIDKDLYKWFVVSSDKNGNGNSYQYGELLKTFKYAIVNAEGWSYFEEVSNQSISKSKAKLDPTPGPGGDPDPTPGPGGDPDPTPGPGGDPDPTPGPGGDPDPTPGPGGDPDPTPGPGNDPTPGPSPKPYESNYDSTKSISIDNPIEKAIYLVVIDDNTGFSKNQKNLLNDFLKGVSLANRNSEFRFVYASKVDNGSLNGVNTIVTVSKMGSDTLISSAVSTAIEKNSKVKILNLWFFDDISKVDDDMESNAVSKLESNVRHSSLYVNSFSVRDNTLSNRLIQAGREFIKLGNVELETLIWIMIS